MLRSAFNTSTAMAAVGLGFIGMNFRVSCPLKEYDMVMWEKHGICTVGPDIMEAFDQIDVLSKQAHIYLTDKAIGFKPHGTTPEQMDELKQAFNL